MCWFLHLEKKRVPFVRAYVHATPWPAFSPGRSSFRRSLSTNRRWVGAQPHAGGHGKGPWLFSTDSQAGVSTGGQLSLNPGMLLAPEPLLAPLGPSPCLRVAPLSRQFRKYPLAPEQTLVSVELVSLPSRFA